MVTSHPCGQLWSYLYLNVAQRIPSISTPSGNVLISPISITQVSVCEPFTVVAIIVVEPADTAVTTPALLTVATAGLLDDHVTFLFVAFAGITLAQKHNKHRHFNLVSFLTANRQIYSLERIT